MRPIKTFNLSNILEYYLTNNDVLSEYDLLLLRHGISILLQDGSEMISALIFGAFMHRTIDALIFLICFCSLRIYTGGLHARTPAGCYCGFMMMFAAVLGFCSMSIPVFVSAILSMISALYIILCSPAEHPLNPLTPSQKRSAKQHALVLTLTGLIFESVLIYLKPACIKPITAAFLLNCILMILLKCSGFLRGRKDARR